MKKTLLVLTVFLFSMHSARGQFLTDINPANTGDPRFIFANPAIPDSGAAPYIVVGYQRLFTGLPLLSNSIIGFVLPTARWGSFALAAPGFQSPHFSQSALDLRYAYTFDPLHTTLGFNAGTMLTSFNRKNYQLVDANDPLLLGNQSLNVFNFGFGATVRPIEKLSIGLSADHLNRPRISFQGDMRRKVHLQAGAVVDLGNLKPMAMWEQDEGQAYYSFGGEFWFRNVPVIDGLMARAFLGSEQLSLGAGLRYKNIRLDYLLDYPMSNLSVITGPSHQFIASYAFEKEPCETPPVACAKALKDTLYFGPPACHKKYAGSEPLDWLTPALFIKDRVTYEILNPQANPFLNYFFFRAGSSEPIDEPGELDELCRIFKSYKKSGAKLRLISRISGGNDKQCVGPCEHDSCIAQARVEQAKQVLMQSGIPKECLLVPVSVPQFKKCITEEPLLKTERQRVDVQIVSVDNQLVPWQLSFTRKENEIQDCPFDFSKSEAPCGWGKWIFGVWRFDGDKKRVIAQGEGRKMPPFTWNWPLQPSYMSADSTTQHFYYRLLVKDKSKENDNNPAFSAVNSIFVGKSPRPRKLLVLFNFDRYTEVLGDDALTPESRKHAYIDGESKNCEDLMSSISDELGLMLKASLTPLALCTDVQIDRIDGYTDSIGDKEYNKKLSVDRARLVKCYLIKKFHLPVNNITPEGFGGENPLASNATPAGRWLNRRVEIVIHYK